MNSEQVLQDMLTAAQAAAGKEWSKLKSYAESEFEILARVAARIEARKLAGTISEVNARFLMGQYENTVQTVLFTVEGLAKLLVEQALNAAIGVLRTAVNNATGWKVL